MYTNVTQTRENNKLPKNEKKKFPNFVTNVSSSLPPSFKYLEAKIKSKFSHLDNINLKYLGSKDPSALKIHK